MVCRNRGRYIQEHISLCKKRRELEKELVPKISDEAFNSFFEDYENLGIKPTLIFRKSAEHRTAINILEKCIANLQNSKTYKSYHTKTEQVLTPQEYITMTAI